MLKRKIHLTTTASDDNYNYSVYFPAVSSNYIPHFCSFLYFRQNPTIVSDKFSSTML